MRDIDPAEFDELIEAIKGEIDLTLIIENLKLTHEQRLRKLEEFQAFVAELRAAGERARQRR